MLGLKKRPVEFCEENSRKKHLSWAELARAEIDRENLLTIDHCSFVASTARAEMLCETLQDLQG